MKTRTIVLLAAAAALGYWWWRKKAGAGAGGAAGDAIARAKVAVDRALSSALIPSPAATPAADGSVAPLIPGALTPAAAAPSPLFPRASVLQSGRVLAVMPSDPVNGGGGFVLGVEKPSFS